MNQPIESKKIKNIDDTTRLPKLIGTLEHVIMGEKVRAKTIHKLHDRDDLVNENMEIINRLMTQRNAGWWTWNHNLHEKPVNELLEIIKGEDFLKAYHTAQNYHLVHQQFISKK